MKTISFNEYTQGIKALIDESTVPLRHNPDYLIRNDNIKLGIELCKRCDGTGNELFFMYSQCKNCLGSGIAKEGKDERKTKNRS